MQKEVLVKTLEDLKSEGFDYLKKITAIDYSTYMEAVYIIYNTKTKIDEIVKVRLSPDALSLPTITGTFKAADWYERELSEMFGIEILGRKTPRLLLEEWNGTDYPLRKSFEWGKDYAKKV
ncbi:MAG: NADH-quinone oxidoreductase subunit C [Candidatus Micrarchaeia archaeon]